MKVPFSSYIPNTLNNRVLSSFEDSVKDLIPGKENFSYLPSVCKTIPAGYISSLNSIGFANSIWESTSEPLLIYGKGSVLSFKRPKPLSQYALKVLLMCKPEREGSFENDVSEIKGQFVSPNGLEDMEPGSGVVFDNSDSHGWLTNSVWAFAYFPLKRKPRLTLITNPLLK